MTDSLLEDSVKGADCCPTELWLLFLNSACVQRSIRYAMTRSDSNLCTVHGAGHYLAAVSMLDS